MNSSYYKQIISINMLAFVAIVLAGCSDNTFEPIDSNDNTIRFNVVSATSTNSRSVNQTNGSTNVLKLKNDDDLLYLIPQIKSSNLTTVSRGSLIDNDNIETIGVFAAYGSPDQELESLSPDYMYNVQVTKANNWEPESEYLWPGEGTLHFTAYSPYIASVGETGITRLPSLTDKGELTLDYTVNPNVTAQSDLMIATAKDATTSPCELEFNHALTSIRFETGSEMYAATIKSITLSGIKDNGTLNLETSKWSEITGEATYTVKPDIQLTAEPGSTYVKANTAITGDSLTFILMPQTVGENGQLEVTIEYNGKESTFTTSLANVVWTSGTTITYHLSINPLKESISLDVIGDFQTPYTGGSVSYIVRSNYINKDGDSIPVKWFADFVDDNGNVIDRPEWITSFKMSGVGDSTYTATTQLQDFVFDLISPQSQALQDAADINETSGFNPYNLSSATGASTVENTANCYIINNPGTYSLPLVYGNAIENNATNEGAYIYSTHARYMLTNFLNSLNKPITDPYIYNNEGCEPDKAYMIWEDRLNLVRNVKLSADKKSIIFDVPHNSIRQGNALIGVYDKDLNILWSWHIWVTDYKPDNNLIKIDTGTYTSYIFHRNIGQIVGDDITNFQARNVKIRFTQQDVPDGLDPMSATIEFTQEGKVIKTEDCFTYFQWGRKDPMVANVKQWYDRNHNEIKVLPSKSVVDDLPEGEHLIVEYIKTPTIFWRAPHDYVFEYMNLWNMHNSRTESTKTVYDPSPAGYKVPLGTALDYLLTKATFDYVATSTSTQKAGIYVNTPDGDTLYLPLQGYRGGISGGESGRGSMSACWYSNSSTNRVDGFEMIITISTGEIQALRTTNSRAFGLAVRPAKE